MKQVHAIYALKDLDEPAIVVLETTAGRQVLSGFVQRVLENVQLSPEKQRSLLHVNSKTVGGYNFITGYILEDEDFVEGRPDHNHVVVGSLLSNKNNVDTIGFAQNSYKRGIISVEPVTPDYSLSLRPTFLEKSTLRVLKPSLHREVYGALNAQGIYFGGDLQRIDDRVQPSLSSFPTVKLPIFAAQIEPKNLELRLAR